MVSKEQFLDAIAQESGYDSFYEAASCGDAIDMYQDAFNRLWSKYERNIGIDYEMQRISAIVDADVDDLAELVSRPNPVRIFTVTATIGEIRKGQVQPTFIDEL